jgi:hypothetical protein
MKNTPLVATAASVVALMSGHANAAPTGNEMTYSQGIDIVSITGTLFDGTGIGVGSGSFDTNGELSVGSTVVTNIPAIGAPGTVVSSTLYSGSIAGNTWTYSGTSQQTFVSCTGNATICGNITPGTSAPTTGNPIFALNILSGGTWVTSSTIGSLTTLTVDHSLTPAPPPAPFDANKVPTMPMYALGITALALFGAAARRLRASA